MLKLSVILKKDFVMSNKRSVFSSSIYSKQTVKRAILQIVQPKALNSCLTPMILKLQLSLFHSCVEELRTVNTNSVKIYL